MDDKEQDDQSIYEDATEGKDMEDGTTSTVSATEKTSLKQEGSRQPSTVSKQSASSDKRKDNERFETAVFTLATFAAVLTVYIFIVYNLSSPPTVMHQM
ncbi:uncharacterized protein LOC143265234 isoform X2 [Megachile rotundata]|uniref:uncharacterized protein LOC143265234 isoform X2 n=1 Tax=Megachile rotundata TaxID=143995 RepID=UPI003FD18841